MNIYESLRQNKRKNDNLMENGMTQKELVDKINEVIIGKKLIEALYHESKMVRSLPHLSNW